LKMGSILDSSIFPKNLRVRWIVSGFVHRTSARLDRKLPWTSPIFLRIGPGSSMARKDRINQTLSHSPNFVGKGKLLRLDGNIPIRKVNEKSPCKY